LITINESEFKLNAKEFVIELRQEYVTMKIRKFDVTYKCPRKPES
jgi:hypothetical protein